MRFRPAGVQAHADRRAARTLRRLRRNNARASTCALVCAWFPFPHDAWRPAAARARRPSQEGRGRGERGAGHRVGRGAAGRRRRRAARDAARRRLHHRCALARLSGCGFPGPADERLPLLLLPVCASHPQRAAPHRAALLLLPACARPAGPSGSSVREIMRVTGADIKSWTDTACRSRSRNRPCRVFVLEGDDEAVCAAMDIMAAAVDRYKELCEGRCEGACCFSLPRRACGSPAARTVHEINRREGVGAFVSLCVACRRPDGDAPAARLRRGLQLPAPAAPGGALRRRAQEQHHQVRGYIRGPSSPERAHS